MTLNHIDSWTKTVIIAKGDRLLVPLTFTFCYGGVPCCNEDRAVVFMSSDSDLQTVSDRLTEPTHGMTGRPFTTVSYDFIRRR
jgi:hypothetical protein